MTPQEAIEIITNAIQTDTETVEQDRALAMAQKALEKQIAQNPLKDEPSKIRYANTYTCPVCGGALAAKSANSAIIADKR